MPDGARSGAARAAAARLGRDDGGRSFFCRRAVVTVRTQRAWQQRQVCIILSFDDGPHHVPLGTGENYTEHVLGTLEANSVQDHIKALFFIQTHVPIRGASEAGRNLIARMAAAGHVVGVHTGSSEDHVDHRRRAAMPAYDWNRDGVRDGANGLESDLLRAKARIERLTGVEPTLVRPTYGVTNPKVRATYRRLGLHMVFWDVDSRDALDNRRGPLVIEANVRSQIREQIRKGHRTIIVLFHDINAATQAHLDDYLIAIYEAAEGEGKVAMFPTSADELRTWLERLFGKTESGKRYGR